MPQIVDAPVIETPADATPVTRLPVRIGFELEFCGPSNDRMLRIARDAGIEVMDNGWYHGGRYPDKWQLTNDGSVTSTLTNTDCDELNRRGVDDYCGLELRSPRMTPLSPQMPVLRQLLRLWRPLCLITRSSGMHVHISCPQSGATLDADRLAEMLDDRYRHMLWSQRREYTREGYSSINRYHTVRLVNGRRNHVEVRIFNGTMNYRIIQRRLRKVWRMYRTCLRYDGCDGNGNPLDQVAAVA